MNALQPYCTNFIRDDCQDKQNMQRGKWCSRQRQLGREIIHYLSCIRQKKRDKERLDQIAEWFVTLFSWRGWSFSVISSRKQLASVFTFTARNGCRPNNVPILDDACDLIRALQVQTMWNNCTFKCIYCYLVFISTLTLVLSSYVFQTRLWVVFLIIWVGQYFVVCAGLYQSQVMQLATSVGLRLILFLEIQET